MWRAGVFDPHHVATLLLENASTMIAPAVHLQFIFSTHTRNITQRRQRNDYTELSTFAFQVSMQLENILALCFGIPTLVVAFYGIYIARRNIAGSLA
jgi:hypothetical protein